MPVSMDRVMRECPNRAAACLLWNQRTPVMASVEECNSSILMNEFSTHARGYAQSKPSVTVSAERPSPTLLGRCDVDSFEEFFRTATGKPPYGYQVRLARDGLPAAVQ